MTLTTARQMTLQYRLNGGVKEPEPVAPSTIPTLEKFIDGPYGPNGKSYREFFSSQKHRKNPKQSLKNLRLFKPLFRTRLDLLTSDEIDRWADKRLGEASASTVKRNVGQIRTLLKQAERWKVIPASPLASYHNVEFKNADKQRDRYLLPDEEKRLRKALKDCRPYFQTLVLLALNTGMRRNELFQLRWGAVDFTSENPGVLVRWETAKSSRSRFIPFSKEGKAILKAHLQRETKEVGARGALDPVFRGRRYELDDEGQRVEDRAKPLNNTSGPWGTLLKAAKIEDFTFHDLRHTFATKLVQRGVDLYIVSRLLGHSDIKQTMRYAHHAPNTLRKAMRVL